MTFKIKLLTAAALLAFPVGVAAQSENPQDAQPTQSEQPANQPVDSETGVPVAQPAPTPASEAAPVSEPATTAETPLPADQPAPALSETAPPAAAPSAEQAAPTAQTVPPATTPPATAPAAQPAQTTAQAQSPVAAGPVSVATAADLQAGVQVLDATGGLVGTVESADADSAVVSTGTVRAEIPLRSFGKNNRGLVISMTRAQLEAAAQAPSAS
jgi:hypothetical protein